MSFLGEVRRRKVFQVAAVYAVVAWLIVQIVATIEEPLSLPEWFATVVIVLLALGFPIALVLGWAFDLSPRNPLRESKSEAGLSPRSFQGHGITFGIQILVLLAVAFLIADQYIFRSASLGDSLPAATSSLVRRTNLSVGSTQRMESSGLSLHLAISKDGKQIAYSAQRDGAFGLYLRAIDDLDAVKILDGEPAYNPTFSPDGQSIAYVTRRTDRKLKLISTSGGTPTILADSRLAAGISWQNSESIIFATNARADTRDILRVPSNGGDTETVATSTSDSWYVWPEMLPAGDSALIVERPSGGRTADGLVSILALDTGEVTPLISNAYRPRYSPTGHIVFVRSGALWAVPFDADSKQIVGREVRLNDEVQTNVVVGGAAYSFAEDGTLVYVRGSSQTGQVLRQLIWVDRLGEETLSGDPMVVNDVRLSPDDTRYLYQSGVSSIRDIYVYDFERGRSDRLTFEQTSTLFPEWTPDGRSFVFGIAGNIFQKLANGIGDARAIFSDERARGPLGFSPDGSLLLYRVASPTGLDVNLLTLGDKSEPSALLNSAFDEHLAEISPDGSYVAYQSNETGEYRVYVSTFPNVESGKWEVSMEGGMEPHWSATTNELFFRRGRGIYTVSYDIDPIFVPSTPELLFEGDYFSADVGERSYDVSSDSQRFLMSRVVGASEEPVEVVVVQNWFEELRRMVPVSRPQD